MKQLSIFALIVTLALSLLIFEGNIKAQNISPRYEIGLHGGSSLFWGDVSVNEDQGDYLAKFQDDNEWAFGINASYRILPFALLGADFSYGQLAGIRDKYNKGNPLNQRFEANYLDYGLRVKLNVVDLIGGYNNNRLFSAYLLGGFGVMHYRSKTYQLTSDNLLNQVEYDANLNKETMPTATRIPIGGGLQFSLSDHLNLNLETYLNRTNTDKLDATVGNTDINDMYSFTSLGVAYKFGGKKKPKPQIEEEPEPAKEPVIAGEPVDVKFDAGLPDTILPDTVIEVTASIKKDTLRNSAKFWQTLPMGIKAVSGEARNADFSFEDQTVSFKWDSMPAGDRLEMNMEIKIASIASAEYDIKSIFFYEEFGKEKNKEFEETLVIKEEPKPVASKSDSQPKAEPSETKTSKADITYRVQVRAIYGGKQSPSRIKKAYRIGEKVYEHFHEGYTKYSAGDFDNYRQASRYKKKLRNNKGIEGAFVVAFHNNKRLNSLEQAERIKKGQEVEKKAGIYYRVQVAAMSKRKLSPEKIVEKFNINEKVMLENSGGYHRYVVGRFSEYSAAREKLSKLRKNVPGAFIVKYKDGKRI